MTLTVSALTPDQVGVWAAVHNEIIPTDPLSDDEVRERMGRYLLSLAVDGETVIGNATLRPPSAEDDAATVIVRILPPYRRRGYGSVYAEHLVGQALALGAERLATVVLEANDSGLRFAEHLGFTEVERYEHEGARYVDLTRSAHPG